MKIILALALAVPAMLALASPAFAVDSELDGKWAGTFAGPDGNEYPFTFTFTVDGSKLTGSYSVPQGELDIHDGKVVGDDFTFWIEIAGGVKGFFIGKLHDHVCDISLDVQGQKMATTLKKVPDQ